jgi:hypothetical protein
MSALPLDQLQITRKDPKTGKPKTSPALVSRCLEAIQPDFISLAISEAKVNSFLICSKNDPRAMVSHFGS